MTLQVALKYTGIRQDELSRVNIEMLKDIIEHDKERAEKFWYDKKLQKDIEAYSRILEEVKRND